MRYRQMGAVALLAVVGTACSSESVSDAAKASEPSPTALSLPCDENVQTMVMWDLRGPGQPTPSEAVARYAGAITLVVQESAGGTTVLGLHDDGSVFRAFEVTKRDDAWWPDGYRECSG